jgi:acyl phosphate:glycerol-3-phosphate acyltransferase
LESFAFALLAAGLIGYLFGSIPFGLILTKLGGYGDIRAIGSGNIGATNVLRTGNKKLAIATLLLDGCKGAVAILIIQFFLFPSLPDCRWTTCAPGTHCCSVPSTENQLHLITALFALLGHIFPIWLKFKGGKGVATGLGILFALSWPTGLAAAGAWLITAFLSRISSLSALVAVSLSPVFAYLFSQDTKLSILCAVMAIIIIAKHHSNIKRLIKGEEPKIGKKKLND